MACLVLSGYVPQAKQLREGAAAKQKAALQRKLQQKESRARAGLRSGGSTSSGGGPDDSEIGRLEAALQAPDVSAATAHGIKKRLQVLKAAALREQRKAESAQRQQQAALRQRREESEGEEAARVRAATS